MDLVNKRTLILVLMVLITSSFLSIARAQKPEVGSAFKGKASYYHKKFHGRKTSSGEFFNNLAYTCAHRTLPFGTMLEVENPISHKWVIVRVNDRGPYAKNRVLDLSYQAAKEVGMVQKGIIFVKAKIVGKDGEILLFREGSTESNYLEIFSTDSSQLKVPLIPTSVSTKK
jgi:rare lipoprotein A